VGAERTKRKGKGGEKKRSSQAARDPLEHRIVSDVGRRGWKGEVWCREVLARERLPAEKRGGKKRGEEKKGRGRKGGKEEINAVLEKKISHLNDFMPACPPGRTRRKKRRGGGGEKEG